MNLFASINFERHFLFQNMFPNFRGRQVLTSPSLMNLINLAHSSRDVESLPPEAKRGLTKALVLIGSACEDQVEK